MDRKRFVLDAPAPPPDDPQLIAFRHQLPDSTGVYLKSAAAAHVIDALCHARRQPMAVYIPVRLSMA
jgi:hypothetical protein